MAEDASNASPRKGALSARAAPRNEINRARPDFAEEVASYVIDRMIKEAGKLLWESHLQRKAFPFAVEAAIEAATSGAEMCFVPCDPGEPEDAEGWGLEEEPQPNGIDPWARRFLRRREDMKQSTVYSSSGFNGKKERSRKSLKKVESPVKEKKEKVEGPRLWSVDEMHSVDKQEEGHRAQKAAYDLEKKTAEKKKKDEAKVAEEQAQKVEALHAEMEKKPHTFDLHGNVIWVEPPNVQKMPNLKPACIPKIKEDPADRKAALTTTTGSIGGMISGSTPKPKAKSKRRTKDGPNNFPDTFIPHTYAQPPILETMTMNAGVSLQHKGRNKEGPAIKLEEGKLSRKDYAALGDRQPSGDTQIQFTKSGGVHAFGGNSGKPPAKSTKGAAAPTGDTEASPSAAASPGAPGRTETLPPVQEKRQKPPNEGGGRSPSKRSPRGGGESPQAPQAQATSPQAPPFYLRARKFDAIGHLSRAPRVHPPTLGKLEMSTHSASPKGTTTQPPLGATMGHGLVRHGVEEFFFPPNPMEYPAPGPGLMAKSQSDGVLPGKDRLRLPGIDSKNAHAAGENGSPSHGCIVPEKRSAAYKNIRNQLFPQADARMTRSTSAEYDPMRQSSSMPLLGYH